MAHIPDASLTCLDLWCKGGSSYEEKGEEGLAHFLEHMIFKGSRKLKAGEFDKKIEAIGGSSNAATGLDDVHYYVLIPPQKLITAIDLLLNLVLSPSLVKEQFSLEREVVLEEIAQYQDQPEEQIFQTVLENCWSSHPYGRSILGFEGSLISSEPSDMRLFHLRQYQPENISLSIAGFIPDKIQLFLENSELSKITKFSPRKINSKPQLDFKKGRKEIEIERLESGRIMMTWPLPPASDQLMIMGADLSTTILSEGRTSRLVNHLRENLKIVESIDMEITSLEQGGLIILEVCCLVENLDVVEKEINRILKELLNTPPSQKEINKARNIVTNSLCYALEIPSQIAGMNGSQSLWGRNQSLLKPLEYIESWGILDIHEKFFKVLQPENSFTLIAKPKPS